MKLIVKITHPDTFMVNIATMALISIVGERPSSIEENGNRATILEYGERFSPEKVTQIGGQMDWANVQFYALGISFELEK